MKLQILTSKTSFCSNTYREKYGMIHAIMLYEAKPLEIVSSMYGRTFEMVLFTKRLIPSLSKCKRIKMVIRK